MERGEHKGPEPDHASTLTVLLGELSPSSRLKVIAQIIADCGPETAFTRLSPLDTMMVEEPTYFKSSRMPASVCNVIACLFSIDKAFEQVVHYPAHIYVLGDESIFEAFEGVLQDPPPKHLRRALLGSLATVGLLYRFNVARKFGYPSHGLTQLRLNGWGREIVHEIGLDRTPAYQQLFAKCCDIVRDRLDDYRSVIQLCTSSVRPLDIEGIASLNLRLALRIVT